MEELENYGLSLIEVRGKRILAKDKNGVVNIQNLETGENYFQFKKVIIRKVIEY